MASLAPAVRAGEPFVAVAAWDFRALLPQPPAEGTLAAEADLRGILSNDSMTDDEKKQLEEERAKVGEAAKLRDEDYQLAYAVDIIHGLSTVNLSQQP